MNVQLVNPYTAMLSENGIDITVAADRTTSYFVAIETSAFRAVQFRLIVDEADEPVITIETFQPLAQLQLALAYLNLYSADIAKACRQIKYPG